ncbi:MAG: YgiT-type zinc finger protein, partial [Deltaproteobacteria bacterium]|nr:YgiT-type zinc finger protein [Deltaproteobacteria bacterium]
TYGKGEDIFVIENVPAEVCVKCGEKTYSPEVTDERFEHIISDHPEMSDQIDNIKYTLENPDTVVRSRADSKAELFYRYYSGTPVGVKYMCVILKGTSDDLFILTAYFTDTIKKGETLWIRK